MDSEFMDWFVTQHGRRSPRRTLDCTPQNDDYLRDMVEVGKAAEKELALRALWDEKMTSALYAWQEAKKTTGD